MPDDTSWLDLQRAARDHLVSAAEHCALVADLSVGAIGRCAPWARETALAFAEIRLRQASKVLAQAALDLDLDDDGDPHTERYHAAHLVYREARASLTQASALVGEVA